MAELSTAEKQGAEKAVLFDDLGAMLEFVGKPEDAAAAYTKGLELAPQDVPLLNKRGWVYALKLSLLPKALADFTAAAAADPNDPKAHAGIGYLRARQKLTPQAQQEAELALLHGTDLKAPRNYLNLHNVACIYAVLSAAGDRYAPPTRTSPWLCSAAPSRCGRRKAPCRARSTRSRTTRAQAAERARGFQATDR